VKKTKNIFSWIVCITMVIIGVSLLIDSFVDISNKSKDEPLPPSQEISIVELHNAYESNPLVADDNHKGNRYKFTGTLDSIDDTVYSGWYSSTEVVANIVTDEILLGDEIVCSVTVKENDKKYHLWCIFDEETQRESLTKVTIGETITFEGTCTDWGNYKDCIIIPT
jgi:hypothetical protein